MSGAPGLARRSEAIGAYRARTGQRHEVLVEQVGAAAWELIDAGRSGRRVVERLEGEQESAASATALARDYLAQQQRA